jgi:hypothetical protein
MTHWPQSKNKLECMRIGIDFLNATFITQRDEPSAPIVETNTFAAALLSAHFLSDTVTGGGSQLIVCGLGVCVHCRFLGGGDRR